MNNKVATPPITLHCINCGEQIHFSNGEWRHLLNGGRLCSPKQSSPDTKLTLRYARAGLWQDDAGHRGCVVVEKSGDVTFKYRNEQGKLEAIRRSGRDVVLVREGGK